MSLAATDLVLYCSANMPTDDATTAGGAIDATMRPDFTQIAANDTVYSISTSASDTGNTTIVGRNAAGSVVSETKAQNGTTGINFTVLATVERVLSYKAAAAGIGTVTVGRGTFGSPGLAIRTVPIGEKGFFAIFQQDASSTSSTTNRYMKMFWKNTHGTLSALSLQIVQNADPSAVITHALAGSVNDSATVTNRITSPGLTFDDTAKNCPGTDLAAGAAIGTWLNLTLAANNAALRSTYTSEADFNTV